MAAANVPATSRRPPERAAILSALALASAALITLALRLPFLSEPLGVDEGGLAYIARFWSGGGGRALYGDYWVDRPPLLLAMFKLAGAGGAVGIRVLGAAAAVALVALAFALGRRMSGTVGAGIAAILTAVMASAAGLLAIFTPSELLASVPAAASVACLLRSRRHGARWLVAAGALAVTAPLVKQSFLDAGAAGLAFLAASALADRDRSLLRVGAYVAGALIPLTAVAVWLTAAHMPASRLVYALFGFRITGLEVLASARQPLLDRAAGLAGPALRSGGIVALALTPFGLWRLRRDRVLTATLTVWLTAGLVGILAGGSYWPHYLLQIVVPSAALAAAALGAVRLRSAALVVAAVLAIVVTVNARRVDALHRGANRHGITAIARYIDARARPGDTQYVLYAKANVDYYTGLPSPYPYAWSLMVRAVPGAAARLAHLLGSARRPTWVVGWQKVGQWSLPHAAQIAGALRRDYRPVRRIGGHEIYHAI